MTYDFQGAVRRFHEAMGDTHPRTPTMPMEAERLLRCRLLLEEAQEYIRASGCSVVVEDGRLGVMVTHAPDLAAMAQENADVLYIAFGSGEAMGVDMAAVFSEVHAANMRKMGPDGKAVRRPDGKVLKHEGWTPADVPSVLSALASSGTRAERR